MVRASKGAVFAVQVAEAESAAAIAWLRRRGIAIVAATPDADQTYTGADLRRPVAVVVGSEARGVSQIWLDAASAAVAIPMVGRVNSLNVATAAALVIYEVIRQRAQPGGPGPPNAGPTSGRSSPPVGRGRRSAPAAPPRRR